MESAEKSAAEIKAPYKNEVGPAPGEIVIYSFGLCSITSIMDLATNIIDTEDKIDILINNAGLMQPIN